jgi:serine/threonine-protein kinase
MNAARDMRSKFGPYSRLYEIGRGGMATVYRATAPDGNLVALKLLGIHLATDKTAINRFKNESQLGLDHPNIVRVNNAGIIEDTPFIEMEYVPGETLDRLVARQGPLTPAQLSPILQDAAQALDYAHHKGVVHRDVKPSNILIRADGRAMLADFGIAKAAGITAYTATTARVGSVFYMSPEQAAGAFQVTQATDVYSLGVTAYYALSGQHPFEGDNDVAIARQHVDRIPPHLSVVKPDIPRPIGDVVMSALEKNPERRPVTAGAFAGAFTTALTTPHVIGPPVVKPEPVRRAPIPVEPAAADPADVVGGGPIPRGAWGLVAIVTAFGVLLLAAVVLAAVASPPQPILTVTPANTASIGIVATLPGTPESVLTPLATAVAPTAPAQPSPTVIFVLPTAMGPATPTPLVINPIIPSPTPVIFPTLPVVFPTLPPPPTALPPPTVPPPPTVVPPTATLAPPTATPPPTNTPLPPTDTPVPPPPTDTPVPPPTDTPAPLPPPVVTVIVAP